jgi:hypothetical protein
MRSETHLIPSLGFDVGSGSVVSRVRWKAVSAGAILLMIAANALPCGQSQQSPSQNQPQQNPAPAAASQPVGSQDQRMTGESSELLKLATDLKAEVDKSTKDTLSLAVIRKAGEVEQMARGMKDRYRVSAGVN